MRVMNNVVVINGCKKEYCENCYPCGHVYLL